MHAAGLHIADKISVSFLHLFWVYIVYQSSGLLACKFDEVDIWSCCFMQGLRIQLVFLFHVDGVHVDSM